MFKVKDREKFKQRQIIAELKGNTRTMLTGERTALNFLCRLSGIATLTRKFIDQVSHTKVKIFDTRKTTPNLRILEKYAVKIGGGVNHRFGLYDMILIKDNHIQAAGGITNAIKRAQTGNKAKLLIEVETKNISEVKQALALKVPWIMLDNMNLKQIRQAVKLVRGRAKLEVSGGVNIRKVRKIAETGVDYISVGALTHSAPIIDMSMEFEEY
jgi:nicotinate-nucleotide pyrophosphorylase (carboxylating)